METITYQNIVVEGIPFSKIKQVFIHHAPNEHATATVIGEIDENKGKECVKRFNEATAIMISTTAKGQPEKLFYGAITNIGLQHEAAYCQLKLDLISTSHNQDIQKMNKTFQNTGKTYEEILNSITEGRAQVNLTITDQPIGSMIMQYNETNWEFIKRMASRFNAPVITNITTELPKISVGVPASNRSYTLNGVSNGYGMDQKAFDEVSNNYMAEGSSAAQQDFAAMQVKAYEYGYIGDHVTYNGSSYCIKSIATQLVDGLLENTYSLTQKTGFVAPKSSNVQCSGRMLIGQVQEVKRDKVKVFFTEIDSSYDSSTNWWFPYSTVYSSSDGSGWYCMPEVGDTVRVFFPSNNEADAFAASSVNVAPLENPRYKSWRAPGGKQILLTDEGLYIICDNEKVFINLESDKGITICSDKNISVYSSSNVIIQSGNAIEIKADNEIQIGTAQSYIDIRKDNITLGAEQVIIN